MLNARKFLTVFKSASGAPTVEFVIVFPIFAATMFWIMEVGYLNLQAVQLDRGVEYAVRDVMTNDAVEDMTPEEAHEHLKDIVCDSIIVGHCEDVLKLQMSTLNSHVDFGTTAGQCRDLEVELDPVKSLTYTPSYNLNPGSCTESLVLVEMQACLSVKTILPPLSGYVRQRADDTGYFELHTISGFLNEPC